MRRLLVPLIPFLLLIVACQSTPIVPTSVETISAVEPEVEVEPGLEENKPDAVAEPAASADLSRISVDTAELDINSIPDVDTSQHTVPLEEILFDTFRRTNRVVPLTDATNTLIFDLRDAIPPIYNPQFETAEEAEPWISATDLVVGYVQDGLAIAYQIKILNWHEIAAHEVDGIPIMATY